MKNTINELLSLIRNLSHGEEINSLLDALEREIPIIEIDHREEPQCLWEELQKSYIHCQRLPRMTITYGRIKFTMESPVVVNYECVVEKIVGSHRWKV